MVAHNRMEGRCAGCGGTKSRFVGKGFFDDLGSIVSSATKAARMFGGGQTVHSGGKLKRCGHRHADRCGKRMRGCGFFDDFVSGFNTGFHGVASAAKALTGGRAKKR